MDCTVSSEPGLSRLARRVKAKWEGECGAPPSPEFHCPCWPGLWPLSSVTCSTPWQLGMPHQEGGSHHRALCQGAQPTASSASGPDTRVIRTHSSLQPQHFPGPSPGTPNHQWCHKHQTQLCHVIGLKNPPVTLKDAALVPSSGEPSHPTLWGTV